MPAPEFKPEETEENSEELVVCCVHGEPCDEGWQEKQKDSDEKLMMSMKELNALQTEKKLKKASRKAVKENKNEDNDVRSSAERETREEREARHAMEKERELKKWDIYLGLVGWQEAEKAISGNGELGIYHRLEKSTTSKESPLCLVYRCPMSIYRHHKILERKARNGSLKLVIENLENQKEIYNSLHDLIDHYRKIVNTDSSP